MASKHDGEGEHAMGAMKTPKEQSKSKGDHSLFMLFHGEMHGASSVERH